MKNNELTVSKRIPYEIDFDYLEENVQFFLEAPDKKPTGITFGEIIKFFTEKKITESVNGSFLDSFSVKCDDVKYRIQCKNLIARQVLAVMLNLQNEKKPLWCFWYLYDYDSCNEMPQFQHSFFLADAMKIQLDNASISTSWMDDCDQNILVESSLINVPDSSMPLWVNMEENQKAMTLWYYQKFYQETEKGQMLVIRENLKLLESEKTTITGSSNEKTFPSCFSSDRVLLSSINKRLKWALIILVAIFLKMIF